MTLDDLAAAAAPVATRICRCCASIATRRRPASSAGRGGSLACAPCTYPARRRCRLPAPHDLYDLMRTRSMGCGDAGARRLPGLSTAWRTMELDCPEPGCAESPLYAVTFNPASPPHCRLHPGQPLAP